jgi:2-(1,2-epoxy-1,2-dihydrophenyl)acetyl-CoA isomerase
MLGDSISAAQAHVLGLVNRVVDRDALDGEVSVLTAPIAAGPAHAQASLKRLIWQAAHRSLDDQLDAEAAGFVALAETADFREGVAAFCEKRAPRFGES